MSNIILCFSDVFENRVSEATLTDVSIEIVEKQPLMHADIHDVIVLEQIIPSESATFKVVLLPHWTAAGDQRTIQKEVVLDIP